MTEKVKKEKPSMSESFDMDNLDEKSQFRFLTVQGSKYRTTLTYKYENRKPWSPVDITKVTSYIPGTIDKIFIKEGQKVKVDQRLLCLEAMKMRNIVTTPIDAVIESIEVKVGEKVPKDHIMIVLKPIEKK